jgi:hypothetical protein
LRWDFEAERFRGFEINHEFELCGLLDRKIAGVSHRAVAWVHFVT